MQQCKATVRASMYEYILDQEGAILVKQQGETLKVRLERIVALVKVITKCIVKHFFLNEVLLFLFK